MLSSRTFRLYASLGILVSCAFASHVQSDPDSSPRQIRVAKRAPESYALLIGISKYLSIDSLHWAATDAEKMAAALESLGFPKKNIRILTNTEATKANMIRAMSWLRRVAQPHDRVVFFYSGHGTQVTDTDGDEADGCDEALAPYDTSAYADAAGKPVVDVKSLILDDWIAIWLKGFRTRNLFLVFDSCFSGGITKSITSPPIPPGAKARFTSSGHVCGQASTSAPQTKSGFLAPSSSYVVYTGSDAHQYSYEHPSVQGGIFTHFLLQSLTALAKRPCVTFESVFQDIRQRAASEAIGKAYVPALQDPKFFGDASLPLFFNEPLLPKQRACSPSDPSLCLDFSLHKQGSPSPQACFAIQDLVQITVKLSKPAYLALCVEDTSKEISTLFPNPIDPSRHWSKGSHSFPPSDSTSGRRLYHIRAHGPPGPFRAWATLSASSQPSCGDPPSEIPSGVITKGGLKLHGTSAPDSFSVILRTYAY